MATVRHWFREIAFWTWMMLVLGVVVGIFQQIYPKEVMDYQHAISMAKSMEPIFPSGLVMTDDRGRILFWSSQMEKLTGFTALYAQGKLVTFIMPDAQAALHEAGMQDLSRQIWTTKVITCNIIKQDKQAVPVIVKITRLSTEPPAYIASIDIDLTPTILSPPPLTGAAPPEPEK